MAAFSELAHFDLSLEAALGLAGDVTDSTRAKALAGLGQALQNIPGRTAEVEPIVEEALALYRSLGERSGVAGSLLVLGVSMGSGVVVDDPRQGAAFAEALRIAEEAQDHAVAASAHHLLGYHVRETGRFEEARVHLEEALCIARAMHNRYREAWAHAGLAATARAQEKLGLALDHSGQAIAAFRELGDMGALSGGLFGLILSLMLQGDYARALPIAEEMLELDHQYEVLGIGRAMIELGAVVRHLGDLDRATTLLHEGLLGD